MDNIIPVPVGLLILGFAGLTNVRSVKVEPTLSERMGTQAQSLLHSKAMETSGVKVSRKDLVLMPKVRQRIRRKNETSE